LRLFSLFPADRQGGEKAPWHNACGHDSAAARTMVSAALSFHDDMIRRQVAPCRNRCLRP